MATIIERKARDGTSRFLVQVRRRGAPLQTQTFTRRTDAKVWARQVESAIETGKAIPTSKARRTTLAEVIERFLAGPGKAWPRDRQKYLGRWKDKLGRSTLAALTRAEVIKARDEFAATGISNATCNRMVAYLSKALSTAQHDWALIDTNPCQKVKLTEGRGRVRYLSEQELVALREAVAEQTDLPDLALLVEAALRTGARAGELTGLKWGDLDLEAGVALLSKTKNGERRLLPIRGKLLDALRTKPRVSPYVFTSPGRKGREGKVTFGRIQYDKDFRAAVKAAGIENFRFHDLRHTAASTLVQNGVGLYDVQHLLGHKSPTMTQRYAHLAPEAMQHIGDKLGALL
jgi:integrase